MSLVKEIQYYDSLHIVQFDFPEIGDILPLHDHTEENIHVTIVSRGKVRINGAPNIDGTPSWSIEAIAGQTVDLQPYNPHELIGLEPNTRVHNVQKKQFLDTDKRE